MASKEIIAKQEGRWLSHHDAPDFPCIRQPGAPGEFTAPKKNAGTNMKAIFRTFVSLTILPLSLACGSAQTAGKPVLTPVAPAAAASAPSAATPVGPVDSNTYIIGADDQIAVTVYPEHEPKISGTYIVRPDGKISLPMVNDVQTSGFTPMQLTADLTERLKKWVIDPTVSVTVVAIRSKNVYVMGEVMHVGPIPMAAGMSVLQAIATAGGLSPYANPKKIYILRGDPAHQKQVPFNYNKAKKGDMQGISLQPGDTIFVP